MEILSRQCTVIGNFRTDLYIVSLVIILCNWVCDNWVYQPPPKKHIRGGVAVATGARNRHVEWQRGNKENKEERSENARQTCTKRLHPFSVCMIENQNYIAALRSCQPAAGVSRALRARVFPGVSPRVSPKTGVSGGVSPMGCPQAPSSPGLRSVRKASRERLRSVKKVSRTLGGHSRDTFWTLRAGLEGVQGHLVGHSVGYPRFWGHSRGHSPEHSGPKGPRDPCNWSAGSQLQLHYNNTQFPPS